MPDRYGRMLLSDFTAPDGTVKLHHFTRHTSEPEFTTDPNMFGKNKWSQAESKEDPSPKTFFYVDPKDKESDTGPGGNHYTGSIPAGHLYDATEDAKEHAERSPNVRVLLDKLKALGFKGIYYSGVFPTVAIWHPVNVKKEAHAEHPVKLARQPMGAIPYGYWIAADGTPHDVGQTMMHDDYVRKNKLFHNQEDAYAAGWHKVNVIPGKEALAFGLAPLTAKQKETLGVLAIKHSAPGAQHLIRGESEPRKIRLARTVTSGLADGVAHVDSASHRKRVDIARQILTEAGVTPAQVKAVLIHEGTDARPGVFAAGQVANARHALYVAAWMGLVTGAKQMTAFHPGEGEDALHVLTTPMPVKQVSEYLTRAGVTGFSTDTSKAGTRVYVVNPDDRLNMQTLARGINASHSRIAGRADRIGGGSGSAASTGSGSGAPDARAAFRTVIRDSERAAGSASPEGP